MNYDKILEELGEFGPWQRINILLTMSMAMMGGVHVLMFSFTGKVTCRA